MKPLKESSKIHSQIFKLQYMALLWPGEQWNVLWGCLDADGGNATVEASFPPTTPLPFVYNMGLQWEASEFWSAAAIGETTKGYKDYNTNKEYK